jgi:hypothetical protein
LTFVPVPYRHIDITAYICYDKENHPGSNYEAYYDLSA